MRWSRLFKQGSAFLPVASFLAVAAAKPVVLATSGFRFQCNPESGSYQICDRETGQIWQSNPYRLRFGEMTVWIAGKQQHLDLSRCQAETVPNGLDLTFRPVAEQPDAYVRVLLRSGLAGKALDISYQAEGFSVESLRLLDDALWAADKPSGYVVVPVREGLLIPSDSGCAFTNRFDTYAYEGCHMQMLGAVKGPAALLVTWSDLYGVVEVRSTLTNGTATSQIVSASLELRGPANAARIQFLGSGDYVAIGKAYRQVARDRGWFTPWSNKLKDNPARAQLFGAINFKLWSLLTRKMNEDSSQELSVQLSWTFPEAALVAEHLKRDLKLNKVLFTLGGWIHRGYDCQHPDILPCAPECGGNAGLQECSRRVQDLGYVFCLHDNYQDIYRDSPSWNENYIMKRSDGSLARGGHWNGGMAYLTCSQKALELARRPQNLPAVKELSRANSYFIDTLYAAGLQECFDRDHPLTRREDMKWKLALSDEARQIFGIFGSECGREWAIAHSDFFEGLTGVSGAGFQNQDLLKKLGGAEAPLFEIVYRDCIALYGKYEYDVSHAAEYVLQHLSLGRTLNYHDIPDHLYWTNSISADAANWEAPKAADPALFTRADRGWAEKLHRLDRFVKNTYEILSPLNELTSQLPLSQHRFLSADRKVQHTVFGQGSVAVEVTVNASQKAFPWTSKLGGKITLPPYGFVVESPEFAAFHAQNWSGLTYSNSPLFTLRAEDRQPLQKSRQVRVFHGFGDPLLRFRSTVHTVPREATLVNGPKG